ncbi:MAG: 30S ribosomal protein S16 [Deltaproteobacteria bacterium]|nr:30S ribosomal protein S16 [Deltaproteobacteria bacterium]
MAVRIRLARHGKKKSPFYRIIATDSQMKRDGRFLEVLGTYDPKTEPAAVDLKAERVQHWLDRGAIPSDTVRSLLSRMPKAE